MKNSMCYKCTNRTDSKYELKKKLHIYSRKKKNPGKEKKRTNKNLHDLKYFITHRVYTFTMQKRQGLP